MEGVKGDQAAGGLRVLERRGHTRRRSKRPVRPLTVSGSLAVFFTVALVLVPSGGAAPILGKHSPPYHGTAHILSDVTFTGCGAKSSFVIPPKFNMTTGVGLISSKSSATGCGLPGSYDLGATIGTDGFDSTAFTWTPAGKANITFNFTTVFVANLSATPKNPTGGPFAWASFEVEVTARLWDLQTQSVANNVGVIYAGTTNGSSSGFFNSSSAFSSQFHLFPGNETTGHLYTVEMYYYVAEYAYAPGNTHTSASARVNMGSGGDHYKAGFYKFG